MEIIKLKKNSTKIFAVLIFIVLTIFPVGCSKSNSSILYYKGIVSADGLPAVNGILKGSVHSFHSGKGSAAVIRAGSHTLAALGNDTGIRLNAEGIILETGRIIVVTDKELTVKSGGIEIISEKSLFEIISKNNVSVINVFSGSCIIKSSTSEQNSSGVTLAADFSVESYNGSLSPLRAISTDLIIKNVALRDLKPSIENAASFTESVTPECIEIIRSPYGSDISKISELRKLSSEHGGLSEIVTKNGKRIIGAVRVSSDEMTVSTIDGDVMIRISDVKMMKQYNGELN